MISVIVPIYKVEKYLRECIESIINQTYKDLEIILVDDGSPDNCTAICDEYASKDSRIKVIHKENGGLIAARISGVEAATGEYVTFVDGDDFISKRMYSMVADTIDKYSPDMVMTEFFWSLEKKDIPSERTLFKEYYNRSEIENEIIPSMLFDGKYYEFGVYPNCWTKIVKKDILVDNIMNVDERVRMGEDAAFTYGCIMDSQSIAVVREPLYYYRNLESSMSNAYDSALIDIWSIPYEAIREKAEAKVIDINKQLGFYLLYLMNFLVRNETNPNNNSKSKVAEVLFNFKYIGDLKYVDSELLPLHSKVLLTAINNKSSVMLKTYMLLLRKYL